MLPPGPGSVGVTSICRRSTPFVQKKYADPRAELCDLPAGIDSSIAGGKKIAPRLQGYVRRKIIREMLTNSTIIQSVSQPRNWRTVLTGTTMCDRDLTPDIAEAERNLTVETPVRLVHCFAPGAESKTAPVLGIRARPIPFEQE